MIETVAICTVIVITIAFLYVIRADILHYIQDKNRKEAEDELEKQVKENHSLVGALNAARDAKRLRDG